MALHALATGLFLLTSSTPLPAAAGAPAQAAPQTSVFGEPLFVNGKRITDNQIKLAIIYGPGRKALEMYRIDLIVDQDLRLRAQQHALSEIQKREAERPFEDEEARHEAFLQISGRELSRLKEVFRVRDEEVDEEYERTVKEFKEKYPFLDTDTEISRAFRSPSWYRTILRETILFDKVFLPELPPEQWPETSKAAIMADSDGAMWADVQQSWELRNLWKTNGNLDKLPKEDALYMNILRQIVMDAVYGLITFKSNFDGLPDDVAMTADVNGDGEFEMVARTEDLWQRVADTVTQVEIDEAKAYYVALQATRDRLAKDGHLPGDDQRPAVVKELMDSIKDTLINLDQLCMQINYFPSTESFKEYTLLMWGMKEHLADDLAPGPNGELSPALRRHWEHSTPIMGLGQVDTDVLLVSALDFYRYQWKENGWAEARAKAADLIARARDNDARYAAQRKAAAEAQAAGGTHEPEDEAEEPFRFWSQLMEDNSEFWDPPNPAKGKQPSEIALKKKGRFGLRYRHDLEGVLGENRYTHWITGWSMTDHIFFDQGEQTVDGPFKGRFGWYVTRVHRRLPPTRPINMSDPRHVQLVRDDYLKYALVDYTQEAVAAADVRGFDYRAWTGR